MEIGEPIRRHKIKEPSVPYEGEEIETPAPTEKAPEKEKEEVPA